MLVPRLLSSPHQSFTMGQQATPRRIPSGPSGAAVPATLLGNRAAERQRYDQALRKEAHGGRRTAGEPGDTPGMHKHAMSSTHDPFRSPSDDARGPSAPRYTNGPPERRMALSGLIRRTLNSVAEREQARSQLVNVLIFAQALLTIAVTVGYFGSDSAVPVIAAGAAAVLIYLAALTANRVFRRVSTAAYILVVGGGLAIATQAILLAISGNALHAAQSALLLLAIILESGLLFAPEVTLITAAAAATLSAFAVLLAISLMPNVDRHEAYLLIAYTLGLQAIAGLIAWLLSQFIFESAIEAQRSEEMQFAQARLEALSGQIAEYRRALEQTIIDMQATIRRAISGEYSVRAEVPEGDLAPLAESLNLLFQRVESATQAEQTRALLEAAALPLIDSIVRMTDSGTPPPASLPFMTGTPLDSLTVVLSQMQAAVAQRMAHVQRLATEVVGALGQSEGGLAGTTEAVREALRMTGALISATDALLQATRRQMALTVRMQRALGALLPPGAVQVPALEETHRDTGGLAPQEAAELIGLGRDLGIADRYTAEFASLSADDLDSEAEGIAPLTRPLPIVDLSSPEAALAAIEAMDAERKPETGAAEGAVTAAVGPAVDAPAELMGLWDLLIELDGVTAQIERGISQFARELGVQSRHVRNADINVAGFRQALDAARSSARQLQRVAGANQPPPAAPDVTPASSSRPLEQPLPRGPLKTRPLVDKLDEGTLAELAQYTNEAAQDDPSVPAPGSLRAADLISFTGESDAVRYGPIDAPKPDTQQDSTQR